MASICKKFGCRDGFQTNLVDEIYCNYHDNDLRVEYHSKYVDFRIIGEELT